MRTRITPNANPFYAVAVLMISESKQENSLPNEEFLIEGYGAPFSLDQNKLGRDIILFFRSDIPAKLLLVDICFESFFVNLSF